MSETEEEDDSERTIFRLPNAAYVAPVPGDGIVHLLRPQPHGATPPVRLGTGKLTIGRADTCELVVTGTDVSRRHCQIDLVGGEMLAGGEVQVTDLGSTNGTFVDGLRINGPSVLSPGARLTVGGHHFIYQRRSRKEFEETEALERELQRANQYVLATLPLPQREGPVRVEWFYLPSTRLGGDAFGYRHLGQGVHAGYILDVAGHGVDAALHSVAVANLLRHDGVLGVDLREPSAVMQRLNSSFPMETSGGLFFTCWYWVYDSATRALRFCSGGHHASYLVDSGRRGTVPLAAPNPAIGLLDNITFRSESATIPPGSTLYLFSDGVFEIEDQEGRRWSIADFLPKLTWSPVQGMTEPQRLYEIIRGAAGPGPLEDDFSLVALHFP
jgi:hypothetical protein